MYSENEKMLDFEYFKSINISFFNENGHNFLAIKDKKIISFNKNIADLISEMKQKGYEIGTYLLQECKGNESDYTNVVMRLMLNVQ